MLVKSCNMVANGPLPVAGSFLKIENKYGIEIAINVDAEIAVKADNPITNPI